MNNEECITRNVCIAMDARDPLPIPCRKVIIYGQTGLAAAIATHTSFNKCVIGVEATTSAMLFRL